jgi:hypothetical protein
VKTSVTTNKFCSEMSVAMLLGCRSDTFGPMAYGAEIIYYFVALSSINAIENKAST